MIQFTSNKVWHQKIDNVRPPGYVNVMAMKQFEVYDYSWVRTAGFDMLVLETEKALNSTEPNSGVPCLFKENGFSCRVQTRESCPHTQNCPTTFGRVNLVLVSLGVSENQVFSTYFTGWVKVQTGIK